MPRIIDSESIPIDLCKQCWPRSEAAAANIHRFPVEADANDGRGDCFAYEVEHPDYDDTDYHCDQCNRKLSSEDN